MPKFSQAHDDRRWEEVTRQPLRIKRVYQVPETEDGVRILVDRLWPRGLSRERARIDLWLREIAPSDALRRRFHDDPAGWQDFKTAYYAELEQPPAQSAVRELLDRWRHEPVTPAIRRSGREPQQRSRSERVAGRSGRLSGGK